MRKLGKKLTTPAVVFCAVLCLIAGICAPLLHFAGTIADFNTENSAQAQQVCDAYDNLEQIVQNASEDEELPEELSDLSQYKDMRDQAQIILSHTDTMSYLKDMPQLLRIDSYSAVKPELIKCLIFTVLSVIACMFISAPSMLRADQGKHTLRELSE